MDIIKHTGYINLDRIGRRDIFIKLECDQFANSFKSRGIANFIDHADNIKGLVTYTTGNHGIALAAIAREMGVGAIVVSTDKLTDYKREQIESLGARVELVNVYNMKWATEFAKELAIENDYTFVPLFENDFLLQGYSRISDEICRDIAGDLTFFFPVGSGSLLLANAKRAKEINLNNKVIGVEPEIYRRLTGKSPQEHPSQSIADSLSIDAIPPCNMQLTAYTDGIVAVDEDKIVDATKLIFDEFGLITEPSGAIALAAALLDENRESKKVAIVTGKNISTEQFNFITSRAIQNTQP